MLSVNNISKAYPPQGLQAPSWVLQNVSIDFANNRTCVVGANGSGKSTLLLIIAGLLNAHKGHIAWQGEAQTKQSLKRMVALASDNILIPSFLIARQVISLTQETYKVDWPQTLISEFGFDEHLDKTVDSLSTGSLKKLQLICAFMREPQVLLLDEPNIALDNKSVKVLWRHIKAFPNMIIVASNEPSLYVEQAFEPLTLKPATTNDEAQA